MLLSNICSKFGFCFHFLFFVIHFKKLLTLSLNIAFGFVLSFCVYFGDNNNNNNKIIEIFEALVMM